MEEGGEEEADSARPWQPMAALLDLPHFTPVARRGRQLPWCLRLAPVAGCSPHGGRSGGRAAAGQGARRSGDGAAARVIFFAAGPSEF
jgi:hypothetical protein